MKALPLQTLKITVDFRSNKDLVELFDQIRRELRNGERSVSSHVNGCRYLFDVIEEVGEIEIESRIEVINGKTCEVIPSRMNYEKEI